MATDPGLRRLALRTLLGRLPRPRPPRRGRSTWSARAWPATPCSASTSSTPDQLAATDRRSCGPARADVLIAIDEEGGDVTRLAHRTGSPYPGNAALGAVDDVGLTRRVYRSIGAELADGRRQPQPGARPSTSTPPTTTRSSARASFGADPAEVAAHAAAAVDGLQQAGVAACAKHFPGHGATIADSHLELPTVDVPLDVLRARDLPPFAAVVAAGVQGDHDRAHPGARR